MTSRTTIAHYGPLRGGVRVLLDPWSSRIVVQWYDRGRRRVKWWDQTPKGRASAIAWAEAFATGRLVGQQSLRLTLAQVWTRYEAATFKTLRPRTQELYTEHWTRWEKFCGPHSVAEDMGLLEVDRFRTAMRSLAPGHQQRIIRDVKTVYAWAEARELISRNRLASFRFRVAKEDRRPKPAAYTMAEAERLLAQFQPQTSTEWRPWAVLVFAAYQGRRQRSILHLKWDDVDLTRGRVKWVAEYDKNGEEQCQPLTLAGYCAVLTAADWRKRDKRETPWVFYSPWALKKFGREEPGVYGAQALWVALRKAEKKAGIAHKPFRAAHGLRRGVGKEAASMMGDPMAGLDWLGDRDPKQLQTYVQAREDDYTAVAAGLDSTWQGNLGHTGSAGLLLRMMVDDNAWFDRHRRKVPIGRELYCAWAPQARAVKIGVSLKAKKRVRSMQTASPHRLKLIGVIPETDAPERVVHKVFEAEHLHGEWFNLTPRLVDWLRRWPCKPLPKPSVKRQRTGVASTVPRKAIRV